MTNYVFQKEVPLGNKSLEEIKKDHDYAEWAGVEFECIPYPSYILVRVETDDEESAFAYELVQDGFKKILS